MRIRQSQRHETEGLVGEMNSFMEKLTQAVIIKAQVDPKSLQPGTN